MSDDDDRDLYLRWAEGDSDAGSMLIQRYFDQIVRFFANKVADPSDSEDSVGRTFEICARKLGTFRGDSSFRTYLFGIAKNVLRDYIKAKSKGGPKGRGDDVDFEVTKVVDIGPSPSVIVADRKEEALLLEGMRAIPLSYQIVLELSFFEGLTQAEISEVLDVPAGTVASRLRRGKAQLQKQLELLTDSPALLESTLTRMEDWAKSIRRLLDLDSASRRQGPGEDSISDEPA